MTRLMIVESPAKCKKIAEYLGTGWIVKASFGHIRDLPEKEMGISFPDYRPSYVVNARSRKNITALKKLAQQSEQVYLATDPDREGESISWHLKEVLGLKRYKRVSFHEVTKKALQASLREASDIDFNLVKAQEGRRVLDRLVGYSVTPVISNLYGRWITAGRVQSVAVRIVVDREIIIRDFVATEYFDVLLKFNTEDGAWVAKWIPLPYLSEGKQYMQDKDLVVQITGVREVEVTDYDTRKQTRKPAPPFITSTLQQAASSHLKIAPKQCMALAQRLFDEGLITYHRTDNPNSSEDGFNAIATWLDNNGYVDDRQSRQNTWKSKAGAQEGHEAMRPTNMDLLPKVMAQNYDNDIASLYSLIWYRTVASQMKNATYSVANATLRATTLVMDKKPVFKAQGRKLLYPGWLKLGKFVFERADKLSGNNHSDDKDQVIPVMKVDDILFADEALAQTKKTKPPGRYTEASLVKKLEDEGIGRPSTYASILDNIHRRNYVSIKKRMLYATDTGFTIHQLLTGHFGFMELSYTREIEKNLDSLAAGKKQYRAVMDDVYQQLLLELTQIKSIKIDGIEVHHCPKCDAALRLVKNKFWGCSNYPDCDYTAVNKDGKPVEGSSCQTIDRSYPCECGQGFYQKRNGSKGYFFGCSNYPVCKNTKRHQDGKPVMGINNGDEKLVSEAKKQCPTCHSGVLVKRIVRSGKNKNKVFYGCSLYPDCHHFNLIS